MYVVLRAEWVEGRGEVGARQSGADGGRQSGAGSTPSECGASSAGQLLGVSILFDHLPRLTGQSLNRLSYVSIFLRCCCIYYICISNNDLKA